MRWYEHKAVTCNVRDIELSRPFIELGREGWELVSVIVSRVFDGGDASEVTMFFKRANEPT